jgi:hypothetical protein
VILEPRWAEPGEAISPLLFGHNAVWCRGGLGVWDDATRNFRQSALDAVRALSPGIVRFPGGTRAMAWHFAETIGSERKPQYDPFRGVRDPTSYGLDEGLTFSEAIGATTTLVSAWVDGSPEETAAMVAYVNGDPACDIEIPGWGRAGDWAAKRGRKPYGVPFLEIGNETYLGLQIGPDGFRQCEQRGVATTARLYAQGVAATARLVRAIDPAIKIGACAVGGLFDHEDPRTEHGANDDEPWNPRLLADAGEAFDHWVLHPYVVEPTDARLRLGERVRRNVQALRELDPRPIAITEHGFLLGGDTMMNALVTLDVLRVAIEERVLMSLRHLLIEDDPSGPFANAAAILGKDQRLTPAYHAMRAIAPLRGMHMVPTPRGIAAVGDGAAMLVLYTLGEPLDVTVTAPSGFAGTCTMLAAEGLASHSITTTTVPFDGRVQLGAASIAVISLRG